MATETRKPWRDIEEIILSRLEEQSPLRADALINQCAFDYNQQGGAVQLLLPHYDAALTRLTARGTIVYDRKEDIYRSNKQVKK